MRWRGEAAGAKADRARAEAGKGDGGGRRTRRQWRERTFTPVSLEGEVGQRQQ